ncbi:MAG: hypothetical protein IJP03_05980, partial [Christensenellaceae bacterium]|nr:hypothetical protein [Christensenellaceae bacterium]
MKANYRRLLAGVLALLLALAGLAGCSPNLAIRYENEFDDLDIGGRCNDAAYRLEKRDTSAYLEGYLDAIIKDLKSIPIDDPELIAINSEFIGSVKLLKRAHGAFARGEEHLGRKHYA